MTRRLSALVLAPVLLAGGPSAGGAEEWTLDDLLALRSRVLEERVAFVQERHSWLLEKPLVSRGELYYRAPSLLEQTVTTPFPSYVRIDGDDVTLTRDGETQQVSLRQYPQIARQAVALRGVLSGDRQALEHEFDLDLHGSSAAWFLRLTPREGTGATDDHSGVLSAAEFEIHGSGARLQKIEILRSPGEQTSITIDANGSPSTPAAGATH